MAKHSENDIKNIVKKMTLEEKCSLLSGKDFWHTKPVERLEVPSVMVSDGPHGLRKQDESGDAGVNDSIKAICFPAACATSCSFDRDLMRKMGETLGDECQAQKVSTLLGPAVNIKRSPLCGRNFEYISEDPYAAGELAASYVNGVQSKHVGTSVKHFAMNNQEYRRLTSSSDCDERAIREIYLPAFETVVKKAQPATIMHSYNLINGTYSGEAKWLLTDTLRKNWGFKGIVMSDWGAVNDRVKGLEAGEDLEMPSTDGANDRKVLEAVKNGTLDEKVLDETCERLLTWIFNYEDNKSKGCFDFDAHRKIAREIEKECIVLLKNNGALPLTEDKLKLTGTFAKKPSLAVIGEFAEKPRFQGGGSSHINSYGAKSILEVLDEEKISYTYSKGFLKDSSETDAKLHAEAVSAAKKARSVVIFAGLNDIIESEGYDRKSMDLPENQNKLISEICSVNSSVIVVLFNGSPVTMPWVNEVNAIVEAYLGGEEVSSACVDVLTGKTNPSGKLSETFPLKLEDSPSFLDFGFDKTHTVYREGIFTGYRYYEKKKMNVLFPFGHGLSYTDFEYSSITLNKAEMGDEDTVEVTVVLKNTGKYDGKETVQLYVSDRTNAAIRPVKELKGFEKVFIKAGSSAKVTFTVDKRSLAYYDVNLKDWYAASGKYELLAGSSSQDIRLKAEINFKTEVKLPLPISDNTTAGDLIRDERTRDIILKILNATHNIIDNTNGTADQAITPEMQAEMQDQNPLRCLRYWNHLTDEQYFNLLDELKTAVGQKDDDGEVTAETKKSTEEVLMSAEKKAKVTAVKAKDAVKKAAAKAEETVKKAGKAVKKAGEEAEKAVKKARTAAEKSTVKKTAAKTSAKPAAKTAEKKTVKTSKSAKTTVRKTAKEK